MNRTSIGMTVVAAAAIIFSPAAEAGMRERSIEVGPFITFGSFDDDSNIEDDAGIGGRLGIVFEREHELEFSIDYIPTEDDLGLGLDVDLTTFKIGYVYNFAPGPVVSPLLTVGGGFQRLEILEQDFFGSFTVTDETDPLIYGGLGIRFFAGPDFNIRVDGHIQAVFPDGDADEKLVDGIVNVGVGWVLGGS